jgi:hypothetical protein
MRRPAYWPCGVRHKGSASAVRAPMLNCGNLRPPCKGKGSSAKHKADSTDGWSRDGATCSSEEVSVMEMEQGGRVLRACQLHKQEVPARMTKPFEIPKALVDRVAQTAVNHRFRRARGRAGPAAAEPSPASCPTTAARSVALSFAPSQSQRPNRNQPRVECRSQMAAWPNSLFSSLGDE